MIVSGVCLVVLVKMSAAEEDTELRDLLIQNLENNGVLNKIKAELRAAVFLALEEQDKVENKTPLVNENLKKCLNTKDGRLVASLITDFLHVFNLDFTLAVFQPEINSLNGLESREAVARELGITDQEGNKGTPLLLELIKRSRHKDKASMFSEELSPRQIAEARRKFDFYDKDKRGGINKDQLRTLFSDLFPGFHKNMLESYITDEFRALDKDFSNSIDFQEFLGMYKRLFMQCRSVVCSDVSDIIPIPNKFSEEKISTSPSSKIPRYKGFLKLSEEEEDEEEKAGAKAVEVGHSDTSLTFGSMKSRGQTPVLSREPKHGDITSPPLRKSVEEDEDEGDSFFDDPLPTPKKTFGCSNLAKADKSHSEASLSEHNNSRREVGRPMKESSLSRGSLPPLRKSSSLNDLSAINSDTDADDPFSDSDNGGGYSPEPVRRRADPVRPAGSPPPPPRDGPRSKSGEPNPRDPADRRTGNHKDKGFRDSKTESQTRSRDGALGSDEDNDYDDDFNSHRSDNSRSELSIGEEIEEVSIEGPDGSDKLDDLTVDLSLSQLSQGADYMEEVA
ncbi:FGFR1 oncogene partner isoform X3 [Conger conger]|uniref:FGFR1 oncogene partner isoform X3 n=1 Tax=Conger conger TaxID=82655 RepID=UPI002A59D4F1|nr:FGFR1 oncogene partner isoform X3 [Conger conger]